MDTEAIDIVTGTVIITDMDIATITELKKIISTTNCQKNLG